MFSSVHACTLHAFPYLQFLFLSAYTLCVSRNKRKSQDVLFHIAFGGLIVCAIWVCISVCLPAKTEFCICFHLTHIPVFGYYRSTLVRMKQLCLSFCFPFLPFHSHTLIILPAHTAHWYTIPKHKTSQSIFTRERIQIKNALHFSTQHCSRFNGICCNSFEHWFQINIVCAFFASVQSF